MDFHPDPMESAIIGRHHLGRRVLEARLYWVSHLAYDGKTGARIANQIRQGIESMAEGEIWAENPNFYVFESYFTIDSIAWCLRSLRRVADVVVVGSFTHAECRIIGPCKDRRIFDMVKFARDSIAHRSQRRLAERRSAALFGPAP